MTRPALWMAAALAVGIAAAGWLRPHPALALAAVCACLVWACAGRRRAAVALLCVVAACGAFRYAYDETAGRGSVAAWQGQKVTLTGTVVTEPELRKPRGLAYTLSVEQVEGKPASGMVFVTQFSDRGPAFGERAEVTGTLKQPLGARTPGGFDQAAYLARQGVYLTLDTGEARRMGLGNLSFVRRYAVATRVRLENVLRAGLPARDAALATGLVFGTRSELPDDIKEAFKASGVLHLLAVSGGNVAMIIMPILWLMRRAGLSRRLSAGLSIPVVVFFVFLTGASPSVLRAGLMAVLVLAGEVLRREKNALNTLGAALFLLLLWHPGLLFDLGFQLSVGATLGILLFARPIEGWLAPRFQAVFGEKVGQWFAAGLSVTLAAEVVVEPISLHAFGALCLIAPVSNLLVLGFVEPVVQVVAAASVVGVVWLGAAQVLLWPVRLGLWLLLFTVKATAAVPGAYLQVGTLSAAWMVVWYAAVALVWLGRRHTGRWVARLRAVWAGARMAARLSAVALVALVAVTGLTWRLALADPPDTLVVTFLDVGQGDAILVEAPGGGTMLVDAGAASPGEPKTGRPGYDAGAAVVLPYLADHGIDRLDYVVLTHPDQDHAGGGAAVLNGVAAGVLLRSGNNPAEKGYTAALQAAARHGVPVREPVAGQRFTLGGGVQVQVLNPPAQPFTGTRSDDNANCIVLRVVYRQVRILLTCDMEAVTEQHLLDEGVDARADILKVAHHGSSYSSTLPFLEAVRPRWGIISAGNGNPFGHPHQAALDRLAKVGAQIARTDRQGSITVRTNGLSYSVTGARNAPDNGALGLLGRRWLFAW